MTGIEHQTGVSATTSDRTQLRCEIAALTGEQRWMVLMSLVSVAPDEVRHALDTERATRPAGEEVR